MVLNIPLCISFAVLNYSLLNIGMVLQKRGASELPDIEKTGAIQNVKNFLKSPIWMIGFIFTNIQVVLNWIALTYGPMSLVAPMAGVGLVVLVIFSKYYLKEPINKKMYLSCVLTIIGIIMFGATSTGEEELLSFSETLTIITGIPAITFMIVVIIAALVPAIITITMNYKFADALFGIGSAFSTTIGALFSKVLTSGFSDFANNWPLLLLFLVFILAGNGGSMVMQQIGFQKGKAIVLTPIFIVGTIILPMITGILLFNEFATYTSIIITVKIMATIVTLIGVGLLSYCNELTKIKEGILIDEEKYEDIE